MKILVIEDNDFVRMQIAKYLSDEGYEVIEAPDGDVGLREIKSNEISIAVVDVRMEPVDGFEFIRTIRGMNLQTPVILVTGDQNPDLLNQAQQWDVAAVLMKPVQKERLLKTASKLLKSRA